MKVCYITIEDITSGLFQTQVVDILKQVSQFEDGISVDIYAINRPWKIKGHLDRLGKLKGELKGKGIRVIYLPLLPPLREVLGSLFYSKFIVLFLTAILWFIKRRHYDVTHCRSYLPSVAALRSGLRGILFDTRSLWILENLSAGNLVDKSPTLYYWLNAEKFCIQKSAAITVVSPAMRGYFEKLGTTSKISFIPISFDLTKFKFSNSAREARRRELGWEKNTIFVYSGSFGLSGINKAAIVSLFNKALSFPGSMLLLLTSEPLKACQELISSLSVDALRVKVVSPSFSEIGQWLAAADVGLHALPRQLDSSTRLGTKVVEYWGAGLPTIVNENVGAAADFIHKHGIGFVDRETTSSEEMTLNIGPLLEIDRERIAKIAEANFSSSTIARMYFSLYKEIINGSQKEGQKWR